LTCRSRCVGNVDVSTLHRSLLGCAECSRIFVRVQALWIEGVTGVYTGIVRPVSSFLASARTRYTDATPIPHAEHDQTDATAIKVVHDTQQVGGTPGKAIWLAANQGIPTADEPQGLAH
jgi:hypothetical protein